MTTGERLQQYRKQQGLSQEELAQKLLVSRQTISLWETDQTLPTVDNLLRLRDIFGVSVDNLLTGEASAPLPEPAARPCTYVMDADTLNKAARATAPRIALNISIVLALIVVVFFSDTPAYGKGAVLGAGLAMLLLVLRQWHQRRKAWNKARERAIGSRYTYELRVDGLWVFIHKDEVEVRRCRLLNELIDCCWDTPEQYIVVCNNELYILPKACLETASPLAVFLAGQKTRRQPPTKCTPLHTAAIVLFVASLLSVYGGLALTALLSEQDPRFPMMLWTCFLFLPIPLGSIVCGLLCRKRGLPWKKNIIAGCIIAGLLCVFGSFCFIFSDVYDYTDAHVTQVEQWTGVDIPDDGSVSTMQMGENVNADGYRPQYISDVYLSDTSATAFEERLRSDTRWVNELPSSLKGVSPHTTMSADACLLYCVDTQAFSQAPNESGRYHYVYIQYVHSKKLIRIVDYEMDYLLG